MEKRARYNPSETLLPESPQEAGFELMTLMPYAGFRDVKSVLYMLLRREETTLQNTTLTPDGCRHNEQSVRRQGLNGRWRCTPSSTASPGGHSSSTVTVWTRLSSSAVMQTSSTISVRTSVGRCKSPGIVEFENNGGMGPCGC